MAAARETHIECGEGNLNPSIVRKVRATTFVTMSSSMFLAPVLSFGVICIICSYHGSYDREGDERQAPNKTKYFVYPDSEPSIGLDVSFDLGQKPCGRICFGLENDGTRR